MKSFGQAAKRRQIKEAVREEMHRYAEHFDICVLMTLRGDTYEMKKALIEIGFDYEAEVKRLNDIKEGKTCQE